MDDQTRKPRRSDRNPLRDRIKRAVDEGRITAEAGEAHMGSVSAAQTVGDLEPIVRDLDQAEGLSGSTSSDTAAFDRPIWEPTPPEELEDAAGSEAEAGAEAETAVDAEGEPEADPEPRRSWWKRAPKVVPLVDADGEQAPEPADVDDAEPQPEPEAETEVELAPEPEAEPEVAAAAVGGGVVSEAEEEVQVDHDGDVAEDAEPAEEHKRGRTVPALLAVAALVLIGIGIAVNASNDNGKDQDPASALQDPTPITSSPTVTDQPTATTDPTPTTEPTATSEPTATAEPTAGSGYALTAEGIASLRDAYGAKFGAAKVVDLALYADYAIVQVDEGNGTHSGWFYRDADGFKKLGGVAKDLKGAEPVDLSGLDLDKLIANIETAKSDLKVEDVTHTSVSINDRSANADPVVSINVSNDAKEAGYLTTSLAGEVLKTYPYAS